MKFRFFFLLMTIVSSTAVSAVDGTSSAQGATQNLDPVEGALGLGTSHLSLFIESPRSMTQYEANNLSFYSVGAVVRGIGLSIKLPNPNDYNSAAAKMQSTVTDYQVSFSLSSQMRVFAFYQDYKGYYADSAGVRKEKPQMRSTHFGGQISYLTNAEYALTMSESNAWSQSRDAGSTIFSLGYSKFALSGDVYTEELEDHKLQELRNVDANILTLRIGRGHNWLWKNWFVGSQIGLGAAFSNFTSQYEAHTESKSDIGPTGCGGLSGGYRWSSTKLGLFARAIGWSADLGEGRKLTSATVLSGMYLSHLF